MPIFIPDLFTSYINGRRQAVADNWQDLSNYNQIAAGQLNNAFNMATFDPRVRSAETQAQLGEQNAALGGAITDQALAQIALQNKQNIPGLSTNAQATGFNYQQALYNHNMRMLTDPDYRQKFYASISTQVQPIVSGQANANNPIVSGQANANNPTGMPPMNSESPKTSVNGGQATTPTTPTTPTTTNGNGTGASTTGTVWQRPLLQ